MSAEKTAVELAISQKIKMLRNLSAIIDKGARHAETKKFEVEVLLNSRLAPDQFNFTRQIQIACDTAKLCAARLSNKEAPSHPDTEKTLPELKARIDSVATYLQGFSEKDFAGWETRKISQPRWEGKYLTGEEFLWQHAIPNFFFHMTTAYAILRHNGVEVGKKDYLGEMPFKK
jgi:uncharacterized protein